MTDPYATIANADTSTYFETSEPRYLLTLIDRGADLLMSWGRIETGLGARA
jgi:hypothetical protein